MRRGGLSRREILQGGVLHFVTRPDLIPAALTIAHHDGTSRGGTSPEYFIRAPAGYPLTGPGCPG